MSAIEIVEEFKKLPREEQKKAFALLAERVLSDRDPNQKPWLGRKLGFEEACDVVFRENRELLSLLAK